MTSLQPGRQGIYYWKCDRRAAFHGTAQTVDAREQEEIARRLRPLVAQQLKQPEVVIQTGSGQGNHLTYVADTWSGRYFVRVENGPEGDDYMSVESLVMDRVRKLGVPSPRLYFSDASRAEAPFAWQLMELVPHPDLNRHFKEGRLDCARVGKQIGRCMAMWQAAKFPGFGPFNAGLAQQARRLEAIHPDYAGYFNTRLEDHLAFLVERTFIAREYAAEIGREMESRWALLELAEGCLVHKDLALWNILGPVDGIAAVIDWDDCIAGDAMDDLSLFACFHGGSFLRHVFAGYQAVRSFPSEWQRRFWLHLLRNLLVKAVIRVGSGYFERNDGFFLIGAGGSGADLKKFTLQRIATALQGLREAAEPTKVL